MDFLTKQDTLTERADPFKAFEENEKKFDEEVKEFLDGIDKSMEGFDKFVAEMRKDLQDLNDRMSLIQYKIRKWKEEVSDTGCLDQVKKSSKNLSKNLENYEDKETQAESSPLNKELQN